MKHIKTKWSSFLNENKWLTQNPITMSEPVKKKSDWIPWLLSEFGTNDQIAEHLEYVMTKVMWAQTPADKNYRQWMIKEFGIHYANFYWELMKKVGYADTPFPEGAFLKAASMVHKITL